MDFIMACIEGKISDTLCKKILLRESIKSEIDAINTYESIAEKTSDMRVRKTMLSVAGEEKIHLGEFLHLLLKYDTNQIEGIAEGAKEVEL